MFIEVSENLKKLSKFFPENLYVVGGYVRGKIMGLHTNDVDICSAVTVNEVVKRLENTEFSVKIKNAKLGAAFICVGKEVFEYTTFRKEVYAVGGSHVPNEVEWTDRIEEDALRRDFTINAIYYNINSDKCEDFLHGIVDITDKLLRTVKDPEEVFSSDGERILRMVRFAGELGFKIEKTTLKAAQKYVYNLVDLSGNRKFAELEKILYCDKRYGKSIKSVKNALNFLSSLGVWQVLGLEKKVRYDMVFRAEDRMLGLLIDIVDTQKPECLQSFLEDFLRREFGLAESLIKNLFELLAGYYSALDGMQNKEYFFRFYESWSAIYPLLGCKSKHIQSKYNFFYQYIIKHALTIKISDLKVNEEDIAKNFPSIDKRSFERILQNLLSKVFDGKLENNHSSLLEEIQKNLIHF